MNVFDFVKSINSKEYLYDEFVGKEYNERVINRAFSMFPDTIYLADEAEKMGLTGKQHYDFLFYTISKKKRFSGKWGKSEKNDDVELIMEHFNLNRQKAMQAKKVLTEEQIETIKEIESWKKL